jgi:hypothetical protein
MMERGEADPRWVMTVDKDLVGGVMEMMGRW